MRARTMQLRYSMAATDATGGPMPTSTPRPSRRRVLAQLAAGMVPVGVWSCVTGSAYAQAAGDAASRPLRVIVPFSAGGAADTSARAVCQRVGDILGQSITIENRTGGNAVVAATALLAAPRDGLTFIWDAANQLTNPVLVKDLAFDYRSAFAPVSMAVRAPQALLVKTDLAARNLQEFIDAARARPRTLSVGTPPSGAMGHLALALLGQRAGIEVIHTPYRGGADAARDLMGGQIDAGLFTTSTGRAAVAGGRARMLAVTSASRVPAFPDVPTIAESGFAGYDMDDWFGLFAAAGSPEPALRRVQAAVAQACRDSALASALAPAGLVPVGNTTAEFSAWLAQQRELLHKLIRDHHITLG